MLAKSVLKKKEAPERKKDKKDSECLLLSD